MNLRSLKRTIHPTPYNPPNGPLTISRITSNDLTLTSLYLPYKPVTLEQIQLIANNTTITTLYISYNDIGSEEVKYLASNTSITTLYIGCDDIGPEGTKYLASNNTITSLYFGYRNLPPQLVKTCRYKVSLNKHNHYLKTSPILLHL